MGSPRDLEALLGMDIRGGEEKVDNKMLVTCLQVYKRNRSCFSQL